MTDDEYAAARDDSDASLCPYCGSTHVTVTIPLKWDEGYRTTGVAIEEFRCDDCKRRWTEILRPIAYEHEEE
jgi:transposase-like protein